MGCLILYETPTVLPRRTPQGRYFFVVVKKGGVIRGNVFLLQELIIIIRGGVIRGNVFLSQENMLKQAQKPS